MKRVDVHSIDEWLSYYNGEHPVLTFKHSTRCSISSMAWQRLGRGWDAANPIAVLYVDLIAHRDVSNAISDYTGVPHASPQMILSRSGEVLGYASHMEIRADLIPNWLEKWSVM